MGEEELELLVDIGKVVFPEATIQLHPRRKGIIQHNLIYMEKHDKYTSSHSDTLYNVKYEVFMYEYIGRSLPPAIWKELICFKDGTSVLEEENPINYLALRLLN